MKNISTRFTENKEKLVTVVADLLGRTEDEVRNKFTENLQTAKEVADKKQELLENFQLLIKEKSKIEADEKSQEEEQKFSEIEKNVLAALPKTEQKRIATMRSGLQDNAYGERYETSYKQAIMKLHTKEVVIGQDSVQFLYAHRELYKQELQLPEDKDIFIKIYKDFDGEDIARREMYQKVLNKDNDQYHYIQEAQKKLQQEGKYIATQENTFDAILNGFEGDTDQKRKSIQFLTGFIGWGIISLKKDKDGSRSFLAFLCEEQYNHIYSCSKDPNYGGSLFIAKNC